MIKHDINNMGDFLQCKKPSCIWGATWSMGHICDYCQLQPCMCPCPLTEEWLKENRFEIGLRRVNSLLQHDKKSIETCRKLGETRDAFKESNKQKWSHDGKLHQIQRLYDYIPQLNVLLQEKKK